MPDLVPSVWYPQARAVLQVVFDGMGDDSKDSDPIAIEVIPKSVTVHRNGYVLPDSWELTFNASDLPVDPEIVRNANVAIYLYASPSSPSRTFDVDHDPMISGLVDDITMEFSDGGRWLTLTGQDMTAYLAGKQWPPKPNGVARRIPTGDRLDTWAQRILDEADPDGLMKVALGPGMDPEDLPRVDSGVVRGHRRGVPIEQSTSYWDVLYKTIERYGYIAYVQLNTVVIAFPRNLPNPDADSIRRVAWGRNLESLRFSRHVGKARVPAVIVTAYDPLTRKQIAVDYPQGALKKFAATPFKRQAGKKTSVIEKIKAKKPAAKSTVTTKTVKLEDQFAFAAWSGPPDPVLMLRAAQIRYEFLGKGERKIVAVTRDLADLAGADMMDLKAGDSVDIDWQDFNREELLSKDQDADRVEYLTRRGFSPVVAQTIVQHYRKLIDLKRPLRVKEATYEYDVDSGIRIELELNDFIVVDGTRDASQQVTRDDKRARVKRADGKPLGYGGAPGRVKAP